MSATIVAIDTGGTFTDFYVLSPNGIFTHKVLSTPADPSQAIRRGLMDLKLSGKLTLIHGSTVATNALLEHKGARVALLTTAGFEDVIEIGRQNRSSLYDLNIQRPLPLVPAKQRFGARERIDHRGKILLALSKKELQRLKSLLRRSKIDSIAVCLLFAFANPIHEKKLESTLMPLKKFISVSSKICPEYREYERTSTTCLNAYVTPIMSMYLDRLAKKLPHRIRIMQSNGGSLSVAEASREAVRTLLSGPAGGALGAERIAKRAGYPRILSFDMGGTSTDLSLIDDGLELTTEASLGGYPVKTPMIRIDTIGAGGGSLAWVDAGGALRVGPESAGADPGPLCYGQGGHQVTVTDAHFFLGRIPPKFFLGGRMKLHPEKIAAPLKKLAKQLRLSPEKTAEGILTVANANMARALRVLSLARGYDPRDFTLLPFGGAGGLHACELADLLAIPRILLPPHPGILSAFGMAYADWVRDYVQTVLLDAHHFKKLQRHLISLKQTATADAKREGLRPRQIQWKAQLDVRYRGQSYEITVEFRKNFPKLFQEAHRRLYGFIHRQAMEVVNVRLQARVPRITPVVGAGSPRPGEGTSPLRKATVPMEKTSLYFRGRKYPAKIYHREDLGLGFALGGPAIIAEFSATTFVAPGWNLQCDQGDNLVIEKTDKETEN